MTINGSSISRRRALTGVATAGIGVPLLAACGDDGSDAASDPTDPTSSASSSPTASGKPTKTDQTEQTDQTESSAPPADGIPTSQVPVGGGLVVSDDQIVITQPTEGDFKAFTAVCTHAQCLVAAVSDGTINCPCHGSQFSIEDGSVVGGPAPAALAAADITVSGDQIVIA
jgi:Rieske Fe-S protein